MSSDTWSSFLYARRNLIRDFRAEGKSCTEIASILSMDPGQVYLINYDSETAPCPDDARQAIINVRDRAIQKLCHNAPPEFQVDPESK